MKWNCTCINKFSNNIINLLFCSTGCQNAFNVAVPCVFVGMEELEPPMFEIKGVGVEEDNNVTLNLVPLHFHFSPFF
jgi:hypothetical protein